MQDSGAKNIVVIGASGPLGRALVKLLRDEQHRVYWTFNTRSERASDAACCALDVRNTDEIEAVILQAKSQFSSLDALIYLAAIGSTEGAKFLQINDVSPKAWDEFAAINLKGAFFSAQSFARHCSSQGANIVFAGSIDGHKPVPASVPYAATKGALEAMTRALAKELGPRNIRVNTVAPGVLAEGMSSILPDKLLKEYLSHDALARKGTLLEGAHVLAFFAAYNKYITGRSIAVDGGL
jgi:3-oxoacyl-[acyl-carrier protein] reductase